MQQVRHLLFFYIFINLPFSDSPPLYRASGLSSLSPLNAFMDVVFNLADVDDRRRWRDGFESGKVLLDCGSSLSIVHETYNWSMTRNSGVRRRDVTIARVSVPPVVRSLDLIWILIWILICCNLCSTGSVFSLMSPFSILLLVRTLRFVSSLTGLVSLLKHRLVGPALSSQLSNKLSCVVN